MGSGKFTEYKTTIKLGTLGDMQTEWWTQKDWDEHSIYVEKLKADGLFLSEKEVSVFIEDDLLYDMKIENKPLMSYRFEMLDLNKNKYMGRLRLKETMAIRDKANPRVINEVCEKTIKHICDDGDFSHITIKSKTGTKSFSCTFNN